MIKIGFDRLKIQKSRNEYPESIENLKVLCMGEPWWFDRFFPSLYQERNKFPIGKLLYRPHPGYPFDRKSFIKQYPDVFLIDSRASDINSNIENADCVIGSFSTSLLNAIYQNRIVVSWQPYELEDLCDFKFWGAQVVESLADIDWRKYSNPEKVIREITPEVELAKFLESRYGKNHIYSD